MDPLFLIIIDIFVYLCLFCWSVWKRIEDRFCVTISLQFILIFVRLQIC
jgi:hypothetical protein